MNQVLGCLSIKKSDLFKINELRHIGYPFRHQSID